MQICVEIAMASGVSFCSVLIALLVMMSISSGHCAQWWSMARYEGEEPWTKENCRARFNTILHEQQLNTLCDNCVMLVPAVINGIISATLQCQHAFKNDKWRCKIFDSGPYFGQFIEEGTRETAFVSAILSAAIVEKVTEAKEAGLLCNGGEESGSTINNDCDHSDINYAIKFVEAFADPSMSNHTISPNIGGVDKPDSTLIDDGDISSGANSRDDIFNYSDELTIESTEAHNNKVGRELMEKYWVDCNCERSCAKKPLDQVSQQLFKAYSEAVQLTSSSFTDSQLVYLKHSPNFCQPNITYGIEGTSGRQCSRDKKDSTSCDNMCCGGKSQDCGCYFVWCCRIECTSCCV